MGDISVHLVDRGRVHADMGYVLSGHSMGSASNPNPDHEMAEFVVWNAVIDGPDQTLLWDTGSNPEAGDGYWPAPLYEAFSHVDAAEHTLRADLDAVGYSLSDIDGVVMSHLHLDHAGGLVEFAGTDVPIYVHEDELKFAYYSAKTTEGSIAYLASDFDHDLNWNIVHGDEHTLFDGVRLYHLPGHTPGVMGAHVETPDGDVLIAGDECYVEGNYADEVPLGPGLLWSDQHWFDSLQKLKELERRTGGDVLFGHDLDRFRSFEGGWNV